MCYTLFNITSDFSDFGGQGAAVGEGRGSPSAGGGGAVRAVGTVAIRPGRMARDRLVIGAQVWQYADRTLLMPAATASQSSSVHH